VFGLQLQLIMSIVVRLGRDSRQWMVIRMLNGLMIWHVIYNVTVIQDQKSESQLHVTDVCTGRQPSGLSGPALENWFSQTARPGRAEKKQWAGPGWADGCRATFRVQNL